MGLLSVILLIVFALASLLLIGIVLIQDEQGEGLGGLFGGGGATSFGSRTGNILTKATSILGAVFLVGAFALAWLNKTPEAGDVLGAARRGLASEQTVEAWWIVDDDESSGEEQSANQPVDDGSQPDGGATESGESAAAGEDQSSTDGQPGEEAGSGE